MAEATRLPTTKLPPSEAGHRRATKLTPASVEKLKPKQRRREIPDRGLPGLYLIIQPLPSGAKSWAVRYRRDGKSRKLTLGSWPVIDLGTAREQAREALTRVGRGGDPAHEKRIERRRRAEITGDNFESVVQLFIEKHARPKLRSWRKVARTLGLSPSRDDPNKLEVVKRGIVDRWGERKLGDIQRRDIIMLLDDIRDRAPIQANRTLAYLSKVFNWSVARDLVPANCCMGVGRAPEASRKRKLTEAELKAVWRAAGALNGHFGPIVQLLILTGQRRGEVAGMRWSEINLDDRLWSLSERRTKNKCEHTVPLSDAAIEIIRRLPRLNDLVFSNNGRRPVSGFATMKDGLDKTTGVTDWTLHDIRRTVASGMQRLGIRLEVTEKVLNHRSGSFAGIVGVYQQDDYSVEKRQALDAWARLVTAIVTDKPADNVVALRSSMT